MGLNNPRLVFTKWEYVNLRWKSRADHSSANTSRFYLHPESLLPRPLFWVLCGDCHLWCHQWLRDDQHALWLECTPAADLGSVWANAENTNAYNTHTHTHTHWLCRKHVQQHERNTKHCYNTVANVGEKKVLVVFFSRLQGFGGRVIHSQPALFFFKVEIS